MAINARFNGGVDNGTGGDTHSISRSVPASGGFGAGTLSAGDLIVLLAVGGSAAGGLNAPVISDDISGTVGWVKLVDSGAQTEFRATWWWKLAVGGESSIKGEWTTPGTHRGIEFVAIRSPGGLNEAYVIAQGKPAFNPPNMELGPASPSGSGQMYVGGTAMGPHNYTFASIKSPPGVHDNNGVGGDGFNAGAGSDSISGIVHINDNVGANLSTDALVYQSQPTETFIWDALIGLRIGTSPIDGDSEGGLFLGSATPTVTDLVHGQSAGGLLLGSAAPTVQAGAHAAGGLLLGSAEATITGGFDLGASSGGLVLGSARGLVRLPHPVPGPPDRTDLLECGVYDAMIFTRGLGEIVGRLPFGQIDWGRVLDGVSTAGLTVDGVANRSQLQKCCALLGEVEPFEHELGIYRNGYRVWSGPITSMTFPPNQIAISAFDLAGWLQLRTLHTDYNAVQQDLITIWINYVEDAMSVENSAGLHPTALALSGILADRLTTIVEHNVALDAIGELERTGIDWTTVDRVMQAGPVLTQPAAITDATEFPLLIDSSFRVAPTIMLDGLQGANCWFVQGSGAAAGGLIFGEYGPEFVATPDHVAQPAAPDYAAIEAQYGRIEKNVSESRALDQASIDDNAKSRYDLTKRPVAVISEGLLLPSAPIAMRKLIPGSLVQIHLANACKPIGDFYRIKSVKVSAHGDGSEDVNVEFQPLGTGTVLA